MDSLGLKYNSSLSLKLDLSALSKGLKWTVLGSWEISESAVWEVPTVD